MVPKPADELNRPRSAESKAGSLANRRSQNLPPVLIPLAAADTKPVGSDLSAFQLPTSSPGTRNQNRYSVNSPGTRNGTPPLNPPDSVMASSVARVGGLMRQPTLASCQSVPDLRSPKRLAPLMPAHTASFLSFGTSPIGASSMATPLLPPLNSDRCERSPTKDKAEAAWGASVLSSLSPKATTPKVWSPKLLSSKKRKSQTSFGFSEPSGILETLHRVSTPLRSSMVGVPGAEQHSAPSIGIGLQADLGEDDEVDASIPFLHDGPTVEEALGRLESGSEGFSESELRRMTVAFNRHKPSDATEVQTENFPRLLQYLGYFVVDEDMVRETAKNISQFSGFDFQEFEHFAMKWCVIEQNEISAAYQKFDEQYRGQVPASIIDQLLWELGIVAVRPLIREVVWMAELNEKEFINYKDFLQFLATFRAVAGLTKTQISQARGVFEELAAPSSLMVPKSSLAVPPNKQVIADTLLQIAGVHVAAWFPKLFASIHWNDGHREVGLSFYEVCLFWRQLQDCELEKLGIIYQKASKDADGRMSMGGLATVLRKAGYTILPTTAREIAQSVGWPEDIRCDFSDCFRFLRACHTCRGFSRVEHEELVEVFGKFNRDDNDGIDHLQLLDLLRYMGYSTNLKEARRLMSQVDFNGNGELDIDEFLYLMRLHREEELATVSKVFNQSANEAGDVPISGVVEVLRKLGYDAKSSPVLKMLVAELNNPATINYENFVHIAQHFRRLSTIEKRRRAGFSDIEFQAITQLFDKHTGKQKEKTKLAKGEVILFLIEAGVSLDSAAERQDVFGLLPPAREAARNAGIDDELLGRPESPRCMFWPLVHLLRAVFHKDDKGGVEREDAAVEETKFDVAEVNEFREIFLECTRRRRREKMEQDHEQEGRACSKTRRKSTHAAASSSASSGNRSNAEDLPETSFKEVLRGNPTAAFAPVAKIEFVLAKRLCIHLSLPQRKDFENKVTAITGNDDGKVDFADFLRLMKWMLVTNFADINGVANKIAEQMKELKKQPSTKQLGDAAEMGVRKSTTRRLSSE